MSEKNTLFSISFMAIILMTLTVMPLSPAFAQCGTTNESVEKLMAHDGVKGTNFGSSVSVSGDYAIIGSPSFFDDSFMPHDGSAYIFKWNQSQWEQEDFDNDGTPDKLIGSDVDTMDYFGKSVSISGDYAIVGARLHDAGGIKEAGAAYIFKRTGDNWTELAKLTADDGTKEDQFGEAVAISGDYAVVGAYQADAADGTKDVGAAYVFKRQGDDSWTQEAKLTVDKLDEKEALGKSAVSIFSSEENVFVLVGAAKRYGIGAAYVFKQNDDGTWSDANELTLTGDLSSGDDFGHSVFISENYAIVGAPYDSIKIDDIRQDKAGAAYIFKRGAGDVWSKDAKLTAGLNVRANDEFGYSVAVSDAGYAVVGAKGDADSGANNAGAVYTFAFQDPEFEAGKWVQIDKITEAQGELNDYLGNAAAISNDGVRAISSAYMDNEKAENAGAAYVFDICASGPDAPTFDPGEGTYGGLQEVLPQLPDDAEKCYYTVKLFYASEPYYNKAGSELYDPQVSETISVDGELQTSQVLSMVCYDAQGNRGQTGAATYSFYPLEAPTFTPPGGTYTKAQQVTPTLPAGAAEIYYTLDDSISELNKTNGTLYTSGEIEVDGVHEQVVTLRMVAYNSSGDKGAIGKAEYTFDKSLAGPAFDPEGGTYSSAQEVTINPADEAFETWYTMDGSEPEKDGATSSLYETPFIVEGADGETVAVKAVSYTESGDKGRVSSASYTFEASAVIIEFDPPAGTYNADQSVTLTLPPDTVETYYTLDGTDPENTTPTGELYDANTPIEISGSHGDTKTLKTAAYDAGGGEIARADAEYSFDMRLDAPSFTPGTGTYNTAQDVTPTIPTGAENTYYTLTADGIEPDDGSTPYEGGTINVDAAHGETIILKMASYDADGQKGKVGTAEYTFDKTLGAPTFSPDGGTFDSPVDVAVELDPKADPNKTYYTSGTDGAEPDENSEPYDGSGSILVDGNHGETIVLKMVSYNDQGLKGNIGSAEYTFDKTLDKPTFSPFSGVYGASVEVVVGLDNDADKTYYTLDGTDPDETDQSYDGGTIPIDGDHGETIALKMVSYDAQQNKGIVGTAMYTFDKQGPLAPVFDPNGGTFDAAQQIWVSVQLANDEDESYFTEDGSEPDKNNGSYYSSGDLLIQGAGGETLTLKMVSYDNLGNKGETASADFTFEKMPGDIDGNGDVDLHDALIGLKIIASVDLGSQTVVMGADVNGDEKIGIEDVIYILIKVSGI